MPADMQRGSLVWPPYEAPDPNSLRSGYRTMRLRLLRRFDKLAPNRIFTPFTVVQRSSAAFWSKAAPLLEKERDALPEALIPDASHPLYIHRASAGPAFAARDNPSNAGEVEAADMPEQRFEG